MAGANRSQAELITNLPDRVEPLVVVAADGAVADFYRKAGVTCLVVPTQGLWARYGHQGGRRPRPWRALGAPLSLLRYARSLAALIREHEIDLVHTNDFRGTVLAGPAARLTRRPLITHLRGEFPFGRPAARAMTALSDRIIAVSEGARASLPAGRERTDVVYNGIREFPPSEARISWLDGLRERGIVVACCFASIVPFKGLHHLLHAAHVLDQRGSGRNLAIVCVGDHVAGYEAYQGWLARLITELGLSNVTFTGWQADPFPFYRSADIAVLPSISHEVLRFDGIELKVHGTEGFPRTHLEAMQFGLPVVGTRIAGVPEQVEQGRTGLLVEPGDAGALADALEQLTGDDQLRRKMGAAGRARVEQLFSTRQYVENVLGIYEDVLARRRRS